jgi:hypothetical protein
MYSQSSNIFISKIIMLTVLIINLGECGETPKQDLRYKGRVSGKEFTNIYCQPKHMAPVNKTQKPIYEISTTTEVPGCTR